MTVLELLRKLLDYAEVYGDVPVLIEDYEYDTVLEITAVHTIDPLSPDPYILIK